MSATAIDSSRATYTQNVGNTGKVDSPVLSESEIRAKAAQVQKDNIQIIQDSDGAAFVTLKLPADGNGRPIYRPTEQDWINAAKNGTFATTTESGGSFMENTYGINLVSFTDKAFSKQVNSALINEISAALDKGIVAPNSSNIVPTIEGIVARSITAQQKALDTIDNGTGSRPMAPPYYKPLEEITIRVPVDSSGKPIKNPTIQDWFKAEKNNNYLDIKGDPFQLGKDVFGMKLDSSWPKSYEANQTELKTLKLELRNTSSKFLEFNKDLDAGNRMDTSSLTDIDPQILKDAMAIFGSNYKSAMESADEDSKKMENLRRKYDALQEMEKSISDNNTSGGNTVTILVPTKRYVLDADGNRVKDANGQFKTEDIKGIPTNDDWANAVPDSFQKKTGSGRDIDRDYFGMGLSHIEGENAHNTNLSQNLAKISNQRSLVDAEMKKISGKFDFNMGNAQTILSMTNKMLSSLNDTVSKINSGL